MADEAHGNGGTDLAIGRIARLQESARTRASGATAWAQGLRDRSVIADAFFVVYERDRMSAGTVLGSAIAFRLFLFFVPLVVFGVGVLGAILGSVDPDSINESASLTGAIADSISEALSQSTTTAYLLMIAGLVLMLSAGRSLARALVASSSLAWLTGGRVTVKIKVVVVITGIVTGVLLVSVVTNRVRAELGIAGAGLSFGAGALLYLVLFLVLMSVLPRRTHDPGALLPGAALTSLVVAGMQAFSQLYLPGRISGASQLYGGIGVVIVTLSWFFIIGRMLSLSFSVNAALFDRFGSLSQAIFALPVMRTLPRRSRTVRRYFGLDLDGRSVAADQPAERDEATADAQNNAMTAVESLAVVADPTEHRDDGALHDRAKGPNVNERIQGDRYLVTDDERTRFHDRGYVHLEGVLTDEEVCEIESVYDRFLRREIEVPGKDYCDMAGDYGRRPEDFSIINVMLPRTYHPDWRGNLFERRAASVAEQLVGEGMELDYDQLLAKQPYKDDAVFAWHQDMAYWPDTPDTRTATVWLAIDDSTIANGCMRFVPATVNEPELRPHVPQFGDRGTSHALGTELRPDDVVVDVPIRRGDVTVHNERVMHGSGGNRTGGFRRAYILAFRSRDTVAIERSLGFTHSHNDAVEVLDAVGGASPAT